MQKRKINKKVYWIKDPKVIAPLIETFWLYFCSWIPGAPESTVWQNRRTTIGLKFCEIHGFNILFFGSFWLLDVLLIAKFRTFATFSPPNAGLGGWAWASAMLKGSFIGRGYFPVIFLAMIGFLSEGNRIWSPEISTLYSCTWNGGRLLVALTFAGQCPGDSRPAIGRDTCLCRSVWNTGRKSALSCRSLPAGLGRWYGRRNGRG